MNVGRGFKVESCLTCLDYGVGRHAGEVVNVVDCGLRDQSTWFNGNEAIMTSTKNQGGEW
jgi:hypothetical protein